LRIEGQRRRRDAVDVAPRPGQPHLIDQAVAADALLAVHGRAHGQEAGFALADRLLLDRLLGHALAIDKQTDRLAVVAHRQVVPVAVTAIDTGTNLGRLDARQVGTEFTGLGVGVNLPVGGGRFRIAGDQDVEPLLAEEPGPALDGERRLAEARAALDGRRRDA